MSEPLVPLVARLEASPHALLAVGIPRCPACMLLPATFAAIAHARPDLALGIAHLEGPEDWAERERVLWPRGIRVSRSSVPVLALLARGDAVAVRYGGAPAHMLDAWLTEHLGPPARPLAPGPTGGELATLDAMAARRAQHMVARARHQA